MAGSASLVYSTYLGGAGDALPADKGMATATWDLESRWTRQRQAFIVGQTYSSGTDPITGSGTGFPGTSLCGTFGRTNNQGVPSTNVGFVSKLNAAGNGVIWSCYIDGSENATESRVALFPAGCGATVGTQCKAYMSGATQSTIAQGFPGTANRFQSDLRATGGKSNATFIVVHEDGQSLDYATHYGGSGNGTNADAGIAVAVDSNGDGYITGATFSNDLTLVNPAFSTYEGGGKRSAHQQRLRRSIRSDQVGGAVVDIRHTARRPRRERHREHHVPGIENDYTDGRRPRHRNRGRSEFRRLGDWSNRVDRLSGDTWLCGHFVPAIQ